MAGTHIWKLSEQLADEHPDWGHKLPWGCTIEAAVGEGGSPLAFDRAVPTDVLENLRFVSKKGAERPLKSYRDGKLHGVLDLQGHVLRLRDDTARAFEKLSWPGNL